MLRVMDDELDTGADAHMRLREAAEKLALTLAEGGMQKTTARVMTALLFSQNETMTATDLCEELQISSGAVSGAVKQLIPVGMIERVPAPGSRRDHYRFRDHAWATLMSNQNAMLAVMGEPPPKASRQPVRTAWPDGACTRCRTSTPSCSARWHP